MIYGYARVSTHGQAKDGNSLEAQSQELKRAGADEIFSDAFTGTKTDRPELDRLMVQMQDGDTIIVTKLDRIARNLKQGVELIDELNEPLKEDVIHHIAASAQSIESGEKVCNFMIHPGVRQADHAKSAEDVKKILEEIELLNKNDFEALMEKAYEAISPQKKPKADFAGFLKSAESLVKERQIKVIIMNGLNDVSSDEYSSG